MFGSNKNLKDITVTDTMASVTITRSGRISKPPERYEPVEEVTDDYSKDEYDEDESDEESDSDEESETDEEDDDSDEDEDGNLKGFIVDDEEENDEEA